MFENLHHMFENVHWPSVLLFGGGPVVVLGTMLVDWIRSRK